MATATKKPARSTAARKQPAPRSAARSTPPRSKDGTFKKSTSGHWGTAAIVGGVAAVGAVATAALFALRGTTLSDFEAMLFDRDDDEDAHQPDGTDASASFKAKIADENTIPA